MSTWSGFGTVAAERQPQDLEVGRQERRDRITAENDREVAERTQADTEFLAREIAGVRLSMSDMVTGEFGTDPTTYAIFNVMLLRVYFPEWQGNLFVGGVRYGEIAGTGRIHRIVFNEDMEEIRRESLLDDFGRRIREIRQGPDGLLYVLTDHADGMLLRLEPAD